MIEQITNDIIAPLQDFISGTKQKNEEIWEWAEKNIFLGHGYGRPNQWFSIDGCNYLKEPLRAIKDRNVTHITVYKATQTFGTGLADISIPWFVVHRPTPIMFILGRLDLARRHMDTRLKPLLLSCPAIQPLLPEDLRRVGNSYVPFKTCDLHVCPATEGNLQNKSIGILYCDETWMWETPLVEATRRTDEFIQQGNGKVIIVSQPGSYNDQTDLFYKLGTCEVWTVPCRKCGQFCQLNWSKEDFIYEKHFKGDKYDYPSIFASAHFKCPHCGHKHYDSPSTKRFWNDHGQYLVTNENAVPGNRSFNWNSLHVRLWKDLVKDWLYATDQQDMGDPTEVQKFVQKVLCQPLGGISPQEKEELYIQDIEANAAWEGEKARIGILDVQGVEKEGQSTKLYYWLEVRGWKDRKTSRQYFYGKIHSPEEAAKIMDDFAVHPRMRFCDIRYENDQILEVAARWGWTGLMGVDKKDGFPRRVGNKWISYPYSKVQTEIIKLKEGKNIKVPVVHWDTNRIRTIADNLRKDKSGSFISLRDEVYRKQLWSEKKYYERDKKTGKPRVFWVVSKGVDNHAWDCLNMGVAACHILRLQGTLEKEEVHDAEKTTDN